MYVQNNNKIIKGYNMKKITNISLKSLAILGLLLFSLTACFKKSADKAADAAGSAVDSAGEMMDDAAESADDALESAKESAEEAMEEAKEVMDAE